MKKDGSKENFENIKKTAEDNEEVVEENTPSVNKNEEDGQDTSKNNSEKNSNEFIKLSREELVEEYKKLLKQNEMLASTLKEKENESLDYLDRYRRTLAEMENLRKRTILDKQDSLKYANFNIISDLLVILDDFQRAIDAGKAGDVDFENYVSGIEMIEKQFLDLLFKKYGVIKYGVIGEEFDPNIHQAMMMEEGDFDKEEITDIFRNGYFLHDRVVRAAQVKIGKPKE